VTPTQVHEVSGADVAGVEHAITTHAPKVKCTHGCCSLWPACTSPLRAGVMCMARTALGVALSEMADPPCLPVRGPCVQVTPAFAGTGASLGSSGAASADPRAARLARFSQGRISLCRCHCCSHGHAKECGRESMRPLCSNLPFLFEFACSSLLFCSLLCALCSVLVARCSTCVPGASTSSAGAAAPGPSAAPASSIAPASAASPVPAPAAVASPAQAAPVVAARAAPSPAAVTAAMVIDADDDDAMAAAIAASMQAAAAPGAAPPSAASSAMDTSEPEAAPELVPRACRSFASG
jgi:hypothetical protein